MKKLAIVLIIVGFIAFVIYVSKDKTTYSKYGAAFRQIISEEEYYNLQAKNISNYLKSIKAPDVETKTAAEVTRLKDSAAYQKATDYDIYKAICQIGKDSLIDQNLLESFAFSIPAPDAV
jgi:hypothetical protein